MTTDGRNPIIVLALDLERTLISDALERTARPGLHEFLAFCLDRFPRVALFTSVDESQARVIVEELVAGGAAPPTFADRVEYVRWRGRYKDLEWIRGVQPQETMLIDDDPGWVKPGQEAQVLVVEPFIPGVSPALEIELTRVREKLEQRQS